MALMDFIKKQFIDILEWTESGDGTLAWRIEGDFDAQALCDEARGVLLGVRHRDEKFFAAVSASQIHAAYGIAHAVGELANDLVSRVMAVSVVDLLEVVEIENHH